MLDEVVATRGLTFQPDGNLEIFIAPNAGACFGVVRAIKLGYQAARRSEKNRENVYSFGPLIHNPHVVKDLQTRGVQIVGGAEEVGPGTVVLRSHGVQAPVEKQLRAQGNTIVDATCPLVKKPQRLAQSLGEKGYFLILVGDANHPEVKGVLSYFGREDYLVTYDAKAVAGIPEQVTKVGVLAQTTIELHVLDEVIAAARARFPEVQVYNTICDATSIRQTEAVQLASQAEVLVVVGGKNSSNTCKLVKICKGLQPDTYHIEDESELRSEWFFGKRKIGVTGGASTPHEFVDRIGNAIAQLVSPD